ncbi:MAG: hypothetical protein KY475_01230 [Planctomycetes bacterium]|nr:hypothetical protein [Planctomycetota bacterium]
MFAQILQRRSLLVGALALLVGFAWASWGQAGKPGGGGDAVPPGRIFYSWGSEFGASGSPPYLEDRGFWSMNADGSDKVEVYRPEGMADLSHHVHADHRWYLALEAYATHPTRGALYAVRDDGDPGSVVLLLEGDDLPGTRSLGEFARWGKDDAFVSVTAFDDVNDVAEIWAVDIIFDATTGSPALASVPEAVVSEPQANIAGHDWSPLADEVVYTLDLGDATALMIKDLLSGETRLLLGDAIDPFWSPDGAKIAFQGAGIEIINPDGTGRTALVGDGYLGDWSPDGQHITYYHVWLRANKYYADVLRISVSGGNAVNLTKDIDGFATAALWR